MSSLSRRDLLKRTAQSVLASRVGFSQAIRAEEKPYKKLQPPSAVGANERILTGHIGIGAMGRMNLGRCIDRKDTMPVAVCDLWPAHRDFAADAVRKSCNPNVSAHVYLEEIIENRDIDVVVVSTPDHWHALPVLMACDARKDIYCEKPLATTIREGRAMVDAVRRNEVVFQAGTMQRSGKHFQEAVELVRSGHIGKVPHAEAWIYASLPPQGMGPVLNEQVPEGLDWDRFLGWTPRVPYNSHRFLSNFRWFLEYSGGFMTDWGVHLIDIVLWAQGEEKKPKTIAASGGKFVLTDDRNTPDTLDVLYEFDGYSLHFSNRVYNAQPPYGNSDHGIDFHGTLGTLRLNRNGYEVIPLARDTCAPKQSGGSEQHAAHWENFIQCVRGRTQPICNVEVCHNTSTLCHMGTCAYVAGAMLQWDERHECFHGGDRKAVRVANDFASRPYANGWQLSPPYHRA